MNCPKCGAVLSAGTAFCYACGSDIPAAVEQPAVASAPVQNPSGIPMANPTIVGPTGQTPAGSPVQGAPVGMPSQMAAPVMPAGPNANVQMPFPMPAPSAPGSVINPEAVVAPTPVAPTPSVGVPVAPIIDATEPATVIPEAPVVQTPIEPVMPAPEAPASGLSFGATEIPEAYAAFMPKANAEETPAPTASLDPGVVMPSLDPNAGMASAPSMIPVPEEMPTAPAPEAKPKKKKGSVKGILIALILLVLVAAGVYAYMFILPKLGGGKYQKEGFNIVYDYKWSKASAENTLTYTDKKTNLVIKSITKIPDDIKALSIAKEADRKTIYERYKTYLTKENKDTNFEFEAGTETFILLDNNGYYNNINFKNSVSEKRYYIFIAEKENVVITFLATADTNVNRSELHADVVNILNKIEFTGSAIAYDEEETPVDTTTTITEEDYLTFKIDNVWTKDIDKTVEAEKTYIFKYKDNTSLLTIKVADSTKKASDDVNDVIKAIYGTKIATKTDNVVVNNFKFTHNTYSEDFIDTAKTIKGHDEFYYSISNDDKRYYYMQVSIASALTDEEQKALIESIDFILNNTVLEKFIPE